MPDITRRSALGTGALGVGLVALAACSSSGTDNSQSSGSGAGDSSSESSSSGAGGAVTEQSGSGSGEALIKLADVPVGGSASAGKFEGKPCVVSQKSAGEVAAFSAICTHQGCTVKPAGAQFHCPCHGSRYDAFTGAVLQGPAPRPLTKFSTSVLEGEIFVTG